jgi:ammonia channel protein AmtB
MGKRKSTKGQTMIYKTLHIKLVYQLLAHGRWFSPGTPASSTTKTGRHDIAESGVKHNKSNQIKIITSKV